MIGTMVNRTALALTLAAATGGLYPATAGVGAWSDGTKASARLIADGVDEDGAILAGIEIILPPGWKTYWRNPGDSGIAPIIDFTASRNVGDIQVRFPTPHRSDDGYSVSNVYQDRLVLIMSAPVVDPGVPVHLQVTLDLGVCEIVCVPESITMALDVPPGERDGYAAALLDEARLQLPAAPEAGVLSVVGVSRDGGTDKRPEFNFTVMVPDAEAADLFIEGPQGWYPNVPKLTGRDGDEAVYRVKFSRLGAKTPIEGASFLVVVATGDRAIEQVVELD